MVANSPALFSEDSNSVSLVHHNGAVILMLEFNYFWQLSQVTFHREYTINDDKFYGIIGQLLQHALQVFHIVVLVVQLLGKRKTTTVHNTCVVAIVADDVVVLSHYHSQHSLVNRESC